MTLWENGFVSFASALAAIVVNALWQDALLVLCVWVLVRAWPKVNAATRYIVWSATLVAALVVPIGTTLAFYTPAQVISTSAASTVSSLRAAPIHLQRRRETRESSSIVSTPSLPERLHVTLSAPLAITIFALWLLLAAYSLVRLAIGLWRLEQLKRDALPLPVEYRDSMPQWLRANKGVRDVRLCVSDETDVPIAVGLFDAMILMPRSLLERLSEPEVDQICLHELAHLRRADDWTNGAQRIMNALLGWNPAAQFIGQQLDLEREVACDDWVLSYVRQVRPYALCLTKMAEGAAWPRHPIPAPGVFDTRKHISLRIERLLGVGRNIATNLAPAPAAAAVALVGVIALLLTVVAPSVAAAPIVVSSALRPVRVATVGTPSPAPSAEPKTQSEGRSTNVEIPGTKVEVPATKIEIPATKAEIPATKIEIPATKVDVPATKVVTPATKVEIPHPTVDVAKTYAAGAKAYASAEKAGFDATGLANSITRSIASSVMGGLRGTSIAAGNACVGCDYGGVNWAGRDLHGAKYNGVDFSKANLAGVNLSGSSINGVDFSKANLSGASFRGARLIGCDFSEANLSGVDFTGVSMSGCQFTGARLESSQLRDVLNSCKGCDFSHADLAGLDLQGVRTNGDDFSRADLRNVNFAGAQLVATDFSGAHLDGANFTGATLNGCDLSGVDLSHVDLSRAKLIGTDLENR